MEPRLRGGDKGVASASPGAPGPTLPAGGAAVIHLRAGVVMIGYCSTIVFFVR